VVILSSSETSLVVISQKETKHFSKFEWRTKMSVWNKVLLVLIFLCTAAFVYLGADALKMRRDSQKKLVDAQKALEAAQDNYRKLYFGTGQDDGYISLHNEVDRLLAFRGTRAWPNCMPTTKATVNGTTVTVQLQVDALPAPSVSQAIDPQADDTQADDLAQVTPPDPNAVDPGAVSAPVTPPQDRVLPGTIVYLFDKRTIADGGCLLGEFTVTKVDNNIATLTNVYQMTEAEIARINESVAGLAPWAVYTVLPRTMAEIQVASSPVDELASEETVPDDIEPGDDDFTKEILADATPQQSPEIPDDPTLDPRPALAQTFAFLNQKRMRLSNRIDMQNLQQDHLAATQVEATKMIGFYQEEIENTQAQRQEILRQYAEVEKLYDATVAEIANIEILIANLKSMNRKMLAELTQTQLHASELIHERDASLFMTH